MNKAVLAVLVLLVLIVGCSSQDLAKAITGAGQPPLSNPFPPRPEPKTTPSQVPEPSSLPDDNGGPITNPPAQGHAPLAPPAAQSTPSSPAPIPPQPSAPSSQLPGQNDFSQPASSGPGQALPPDQTQAAATPEPPKTGQVQFTAHAEGKLQDPVSATFSMASVGSLNYQIDGTSVTGSGSAKVNANIVGDIGVGKCTGVDAVPVRFDVVGRYNSQTNSIIIKPTGISPSSATIDLSCTSTEECSEDLNYKLTVPMLFFGDAEGGIELPLKQNAQVNTQIRHPVPSWGIVLVGQWRFLVMLPEFDFAISVNPHVVTIKQGETALAYVTPNALKGSGTVTLSSTQFSKIRGYFGANPVNAPGPASSFVVETFCDTPPTEYLYTIRGEAASTFKTSVDSVKVIVNPNPDCRGKNSTSWPALQTYH